MKVVFPQQNTWANYKGHTVKCYQKGFLSVLAYKSQKYLNFLNCYLSSSSNQCYSCFRAKLVKCTSFANCVCPTRKPKECSKLGQKNHFGESGRGSKSPWYRSMVNTHKLGQFFLGRRSSRKDEHSYWGETLKPVLPFQIVCT